MGRRAPLDTRLISIADNVMFPMPSDMAAASSIPPDTVSSIPRSRNIRVGHRVRMGNSMTSMPIMPIPTNQTSFSFSTAQIDASPGASRLRSPATAIGSSVRRSFPIAAQTRVTTRKIKA